MEKKKVLILAHDFPPYVSVGGMRPYGWFKYLNKEKYEVTVITRSWNEKVISALDCIRPSSNKAVISEVLEAGIVYRVPYFPNLRDRIILKFGLNKLVFIRRILSFFIDLFKHSFFFFDSSKEIYKQADKILQEEVFDFIIATGEPFILFKYAHLLSKKHQVKWIGDYRDGWTTNQRKAALSITEKVLLKNYRVKELKYVRSASLITTAAQDYKVELQKFIQNKEIKVILNGFITDKNELLENKSSIKKFEISYLGTLYGHQNVGLFLQGVEAFLIESKLSTDEFQINFIGMDFYREQKERVLNSSNFVVPYLNFTEKIPFNELPQIIKNTSLLLLLSKKDMNWLNAKIFDYLLFNRRVLFIGNDYGILEKLLIESENTSIYADEVSAIHSELNKVYEEFKQKSFLANENNSAKVFQYSRENQTKYLEEYLDLL